MHLLLELLELIVLLLAVIFYLLLSFITRVLDAFRPICGVQLVSIANGVLCGDGGRYIL